MFRRLDSFQRRLGRRRRDGRRDACHVQPGCIRQGRRPIVGDCRSQTDSRPVAIVNNVAGPLVDSAFDEVHPQPTLAAAHDILCVDTERVERLETGVRHRMIGQGGDETGHPAQLANRHRHVRFGPRKHHFDIARQRLRKPAKSNRVHAPHDFTKGDNGSVHEDNLPGDGREVAVNGFSVLICIAAIGSITKNVPECHGLEKNFGNNSPSRHGIRHLVERLCSMNRKIET